MRSRSDARLRQAVKEADHRWAGVVARLRAERVQSELELEEARVSLKRLSKTVSDRSRLEMSRTEARLAAERIERERVSALRPPLLDREVHDDKSAFAETQPMDGDFDDSPRTRRFVSRSDVQPNLASERAT